LKKEGKERAVVISIFNRSLRTKIKDWSISSSKHRITTTATHQPTTATATTEIPKIEGDYCKKKKKDESHVGAFFAHGYVIGLCRC